MIYSNKVLGNYSECIENTCLECGHENVRERPIRTVVVERQTVWERNLVRRVERMTGLFELLPIPDVLLVFIFVLSFTSFDRKYTSTTKTEKQWWWVGAAVMLCIAICSLDKVSSCLSFDPISWQLKYSRKLSVVRSI